MNSNLQLDMEGFYLYYNLVKKRVEHDISLTTSIQKQESSKASEYDSDPSTFVDYFKKPVGKYKARKSDKLSKEIRSKEKWLKEWENAHYEILKEKLSQEDIRVLENQSIYDLVRKQNEIKVFLAMQDAVLAPIYEKLNNDSREDYSKIQERDIYTGLNIIASSCGFSSDQGRRIYDNTEKFYKELDNKLPKLFKIGGITALISAATLGLLAFPIAGAIGSIMGLQGAAASSAGLALLGGGSLASGSLGMAGVLAMLVGGGGAVSGFATAAGAAATKMVEGISDNKTSDEYLNLLLVEMPKKINLIEFLKENKEKKIGNTGVKFKERISQECEQFLNFKHKYETETLLTPKNKNQKDKNQKENIIKGKHVLDKTYDKMFEIV